MTVPTLEYRDGCHLATRPDQIAARNHLRRMPRHTDAG